MTKEQAAQLNAILEQVKASGIELNTSIKEANKALQAQGTQLNQNRQAALDMAQALVDGRDAIEAAAEINQKVYSTLQEENTLSEQKLLLQQTLLAGHQEISQIVESNADVSADELEKLSEELTGLQQKVKLQQQVKTETEKTAQQTLLASNYVNIQEKAVAKVKQGVEATGGILTGIYDKIKGGAQYGAQFVAGTYMGAKTLIDATGQAKAAYTALDQLGASFRRNTGLVLDSDLAMKKFTDRIIESARNQVALGVTTKDMGTAYAKMMEDSRTFGLLMADNTEASEMQVKILAEHAAKAEKMGISLKTTASVVELVGKAYREQDLAMETSRISEEMINLARATGQTVDKVGQDAVKAFDKLAVYSLPQATKIFKELSVTASQTGISVDELLKGVAKFDDMEKAAESVGDLNAMLGGPYLNTLDLVNATEEERIAMIREAVEASGESFDEMDRFKQKAIAAEMGLSAQQAKAYFGVSQAAIDTATAGVDQNKSTMKDLQDAAEKNAVSMKDRWGAAQESVVMVEGALQNVQSASNAASEAVAKAGGKIREALAPTIAKMSKEMSTAITEQAGKLKNAKNLADMIQIIGELGTKALGISWDQVTKMGTEGAPSIATAQEGPGLEERFMKEFTGAPGQPAAVGPGGGGGRIVIENKMYLDKDILWQKIDEKVSFEIQRALESQ